MTDPKEFADPVSDSEPCRVGAHAAVAPADWDARAAIDAAVLQAGAGGHVLLASLTLRLARHGHVSAVRVRIAGGTPLEAIRAALAEAALVTAPEAGARLSAYEAAGDEQFYPGSAPRADAAHALAKRTRACVNCGRVFPVNLRHASSHRFCSAVCRSQYRRLTLRHQEAIPKPTEAISRPPNSALEADAGG